MIILVLYVVFAIAFAVIGARMARSRNRDPAIWALICCLFPLLGVIVLAVAGSASQSASVAVANDQNWQKWSVLRDLDPDIRAAAERMRAKGPPYERLLAEKYMTLGDKNYLAPAEEAVARQLESEDAEATAVYAEMLAETRHGQMPSRYKVAAQIFLVSVICAVPSPVAFGVFHSIEGAAALGVAGNVAIIAYSAFVGWRLDIRTAAIKVGLGCMVFAITWPVVAGTIFAKFYNIGMSDGQLLAGIGSNLLWGAICVAAAAVAAKVAAAKRTPATM